ncbi:hypothetical protein BKA82DRAFT_4466333 [Pisolithus tinctorius]|nr:hypothetical protein BKA82DRAFT_4466333 [Pisolithus tinctorius]
MSNSKFVMKNIWVAGNIVVYEGNARNLGGTFEYFKDVHRGILMSGLEVVHVHAFPGGASTPASSRDGRPLAFAHHVRDKLLGSSRINWPCSLKSPKRVNLSRCTK